MLNWCVTRSSCLTENSTILHIVYEQKHKKLPDCQITNVRTLPINLSSFSTCNQLMCDYSFLHSVQFPSLSQVHKYIISLTLTNVDQQKNTCRRCMTIWMKPYNITSVATLNAMFHIAGTSTSDSSTNEAWVHSTVKTPKFKDFQGSNFACQAPKLSA